MRTAKSERRIDLEKLKKEEEELAKKIEGMTRLQQAIIYKQIYMLGWRISDTDAAIRQEMGKA